MRGGGYLSSSSLCQRKSNRIFVHWTKILYFVTLFFQWWQRKYYHWMMTIIKSLWHTSTIFALKAILHVTNRNHTTSNASIPKLNHKLYHFLITQYSLKTPQESFYLPFKMLSCTRTLVQTSKRGERISVFDLFSYSQRP